MLTKRGRLNLKIKKYKLLNKKLKKYKPISFDLSNFSDYDVPVKGTPLERKRVVNMNYRRRVRELRSLLDRRIREMERVNTNIEGPIFMAEFEPLLTFTKKDEAEIEAMTKSTPTFNLNIFEHI